MAVGFIAMDPGWVMTHVNAEAERITGRPRAQLPGRTLWEAFPATVGTEGWTWQVFGGTVYFPIAAALFSLGVGTLLRSSAGAITVALTVLLLLPTFLVLVTLDWVETAVEYLPLPASGAFLGGGEDSLSAVGNGLGPATGLLVVAAYAVVPLVAGAAVLRRRDA
jgi:ABC-2 type transport system permease protein